MELHGMDERFDIICIGMALIDSIIRGFDPNPVSASGYRAESGSLNVGGEALRFANACGAICTTAVGAVTALKDRDQVLDFMKELSR